MILTITLNPSVDIGYKLDSFLNDKVNRVSNVSKTAGGKGLNVTRVLHQLGDEVTATGFLGGSLGDFISTEISQFGINDGFVRIQGETRNCIAVLHEGKQTEILESGPAIAESESDLFLEKFSEYIQDMEIVTVSGSLPKGLADDFYQYILQIAHRKNTRVLLDTKGELLGQTLKSENKPYLIKPNDEELADLIGENLKDDTSVVKALNAPILHDVPMVVVTLGADGALIKQGDRIYRAYTPKVNAVNPVGSGDSVLAGFASGLAKRLSDEYLIKYGLTMGVLNAMEDKTGHINAEKVDWCVDEIQVERVV